jgi:CheY-like chemotaxis protein
MSENDINQEIISNGNVRTLIVDDDSGIQDLFRKSIFVAVPEFKVQFVKDLPSALYVLRKSENTDGSIELVITDLNLSDHGQEGFMVIEEAKRRGVKQIILYSADAEDPEVRKKAEELGANRIIPKPAPLKEIRSTLREAGNTIKNSRNIPLA